MSTLKIIAYTAPIFFFGRIASAVSFPWDMIPAAAWGAYATWLIDKLTRKAA